MSEATTPFVLIALRFAETGEGRTLIDWAGYQPGEEGTYPAAYVLAHLPGNTLHPYVTWMLVMPDNAPAYTVSGDYCITIAAGRESLAERAAR